MKTKKIIVNENIANLLDNIYYNKEESITEFIESYSIDTADFIKFINDYYRDDEDVKSILDDIENYESLKRTKSLTKKSSRTNFEELLDAKVHFGHVTNKWNPGMAPYIFMKRNGYHIIDLYKTIKKIDEAATAIKEIAKSGRKIMFVGTKKLAKDIIAEKAKLVGMPYVTERWPGGMLTNFPTILKAVKKMTTIDKMSKDGIFDQLSKREKLQIKRQRAKLEKNLGSIADLNRLPSALFIVDVLKEHIAVAEANRLGIPVFAMVDTNSNPNNIDFVIPANDDATQSIELITTIITKAIEEGIEERMPEHNAANETRKRKLQNLMKEKIPEPNFTDYSVN